MTRSTQLPVIACCQPPGDPTLDEAGALEAALLLKALADPARLRIVNMVSAAGEACNCDFTGPLGLSQPTVSHHLKVLTDAGILAREKRGKWAYFTVNRDRMAQAAATLTPPA